MSTLYEQDFYSWTQQQAEILRRGGELRLNAPDGIDWEHVAEEIEQLGKDKLDELYSRYVILVAHLLKWCFQAPHRSSSWRGTINEQRSRIARLIRKNPGVKLGRSEEFEDAYKEARQRAIDDTGMPAKSFPATCPFTLEQVEDQAFWPDEERP
jgi:hypothetical protein